MRAAVGVEEHGKGFAGPSAVRKQQGGPQVLVPRVHERDVGPKDRPGRARSDAAHLPVPPPDHGGHVVAVDRGRRNDQHVPSRHAAVHPRLLGQPDRRARGRRSPQMDVHGFAVRPRKHDVGADMDETI